MVSARERIYSIPSELVSHGSGEVGVPNKLVEKVVFGLSNNQAVAVAVV